MKPAKAFGVLFILVFILLNFQSVLAVDCPSTDYDCQINELQRELDARKDAHEKNKISLAEYEKELTRINQRLVTLDKQLKDLEIKIKNQQFDLAFQEELLSQRVRSYFIERKRFSFIMLLLSSGSARELTRELGFRQQVANQDRRLIGEFSTQLINLKNDKESLEKSKISMASLKKNVSAQAEFMRGEVAKTESFFTQILAKQDSLRALKAGGFQTSVGEVPPADDPASRPDYNPGFSPAFAVFSFGAPHRKGMSQYGAYGRAKANQSAEEILRAYYGGVEIKKDYSTSINITVSGYGAVDIETYVKRIYEMPSSWGDNGGFEALKAQAVAARSYALAYTNNGSGSICATESCQVYKPANKGGKWEEAVNATRGWVLVASGKPFSAWYASTAGGYTFSYSYNDHSTPGLWDTPSGKDGWTDQAWEKQAGSPWFYKAWYRKRSGEACGRSHPWLTQEEFSDLINALLVSQNDQSALSHLSSLDASSCFGTQISDTWDMGRVRQEAARFGGSVTQVNSVSVIYSNDGFTQEVSFGTDRGTKTFSGEAFKDIFNLRAPAAIGVKSSLFNIMKK